MLTALPALAAPPALPDQFGNPVALTDFSGQPVLVIVTSERQLRQLQRWEKKLRAQLPGLISMRVADIVSEPKPTQQQVADKLIKHAPAEVSVAIDMDNIWATAYLLDTGEPCLLIFDANEQIVNEFRGRPGKKLTAEVLDALAPYFLTETGDS